MGEENMKIFWSWQSDHPGKVSRHFIKNTIERALKELKSTPKIDEPIRKAQLDHDRKGVPGSPDLANIILKKIKNSDVFIADVTPIGSSDNTHQKPIMNPNVAIELGYSLATVTDRGLIMILNKHYGDRNSLPFDLAHKAGPIIYNLAPDASKEEIEVEEKKLSSILKIALREMLNSKSVHKKLHHEKTPSLKKDPSRFTKPNTILAKFGTGDYDEMAFSLTGDPLVYIRVIPRNKVTLLRRAESNELIKLIPLPWYGGGYSSLTNNNKYGSISFNSDAKTLVINSAVQLFLNREIWAFSNYRLRKKDDGTFSIPMKAIENDISYSLSKYLAFSVDHLNLSFPIDIEVGAYPVKEYKFIYADKWGEGPDIVMQDHIYWKGSVHTQDNEAVENILREIFRTFFDAAVIERPYNYNGL